MYFFNIPEFCWVVGDGLQCVLVIWAYLSSLWEQQWPETQTQENFQVGGHLSLSGVGYSNSCGCAWTQSSLSHALPQPIKTGVIDKNITQGSTHPSSHCLPTPTSKKQSSSCSRLEEESLARATETSEAWVSGPAVLVKAQGQNRPGPDFEEGGLDQIWRRRPEG